MATLRNRNNAIAMLDNLREFGYQDSQILDLIISHFLSGEQAYNVMEHVYDEFGLDEGEDETKQ
jgi:DNA polymerase III delta subunit